MATRYVYWKDETGRASRDRAEHHSLNVMLKRIGEASSINENGKATFHGLIYTQYEPLLLHSLVAVHRDERMPELELGGLLWGTVCELVENSGGKTPIEPRQLLEKLNVKAAAYFRQEYVEFAIATYIASATLPHNAFDFDGMRIELGASFDYLEFPQSMQTISREHAPPPGSTRVKVVVNARTAVAAFERAIDALQLICVLWHIGDGSRRIASIGTAKHQPINSLRPGPVYSVHHSSGKPAIDSYWLEPDFWSSIEHASQRAWERREEFRGWALTRISDCPYRRDLIAVLMKYADALASRNPNMAVLRLWSVLEYITNTVGARYDKLIKRASWIFLEPSAPREVLRCIRRYRNEFVHSARPSEQSSAMADSLNWIVAEHVGILLRNEFRVSSFAEYQDILSASAQEDRLRRDASVLVKASRLRANWRRAKSKSQPAKDASGRQ